MRGHVTAVGDVGGEGGELNAQGVGLATEAGIVVLELTQRIRMMHLSRRGKRRGICIWVEAGRIDNGLQALDGFLELGGTHQRLDGENTAVTQLTVSMYFLRLARWRAWARALRERECSPVPLRSSSCDGGE